MWVFLEKKNNWTSQMVRRRTELQLKNDGDRREK